MHLRSSSPIDEPVGDGLMNQLSIAGQTVFCSSANCRTCFASKGFTASGKQPCKRKFGPLENNQDEETRFVLVANR